LHGGIVDSAKELLQFALKDGVVILRVEELRIFEKPQQGCRILNIKPIQKSNHAVFIPADCFSETVRL